MGSKRYLIFFLLSGMIAGLMQIILIPNSQVPIIGASGAIASVLGAYFVMYPRARVVTLIFIFFIPWFVKLPALLYLGLWFATQVVYGLSKQLWVVLPGGGISVGFYSACSSTGCLSPVFTQLSNVIDKTTYFRDNAIAVQIRG